MLLSYIKAIKKRTSRITISFKEKDIQLVIGGHPKEDMKHKQGRKSYKVPVSMQRPIFVLLVLGIFYNLQAQPVRKPQFNKWVFPNFCQLDFTGGGAPVFSKTGAAYVIESSGCYADQSGNVLFYSDGVNMYDATHSIMPNGVLWSSAGGRMGPLIIPIIGNPDRYYAFQVDGGSTTFTQPACGPLARFDGLYYHIIDMTLNGGLGDIVAGRKNISLVDSTGESVIGMMHENGKDFWIIVRKAHSNNYYSFLVTQSGVCTTPVISSFTGGIPSNPRGLMTLAPSHDATQIAVSQGSTISGGLLQLFDFESCSGRLSNPTNISNSLRGWYDVAFSPNDSLIYATFTSGGFLNASFFQYERFAGNIPASQNTIGGSIPWGYHPNVLGYLGMRVYGDTLYIANADSSIHILETPNTVGSPGLITHWLHTAPFGSRVSYNFPNYFDYELDFKEKSYVAARDTFVCPGDSLQIGSSVNCVDPEYIYSWSPSTGLDFDTVPNPWAQPTVTTEYIVTINFLCFTYTDTITVYASVVSVSNDTTICIGDSTVLSASGGITYLWSNGDTTASTTVLPSVDTTYFVAVTDSFCTITDSIVVSLATSVIADISPLTYSGCAPDTIAFTNSSNGTDYFWDFGNGDTSVLVSPTYIYTASGTYNGSLAAIDSSSCNVTDTVFFVVNISSLTVDAGPNTVICSGDSMVLTASGGISYLWSTGDTTASITVSPSVNTTYYVTGTDGICFTTDSVVVNVPSTVVADISPLTYSGCAPDTIAFTNNSNGTDYFWDFGNGDTSTQVSPTYTYTSAGTFNGSLVATDSSSCNIKDTITFVITISTLSVDAGDAVTICDGDSTVLTAIGGSTYLWDTGDTTASITVSPSANTTYFVTGSDGICFVTDSVEVKVPAPVIADVSPLTYSGCAPDTIAFTNSSNGTDYFWDFGNGDTSTQVSPTYTYASAGIFNGSLIATDSSSCNIKDTVTFVITISTLSIDAGIDVTICSGDSTVLTAIGGSTYLWDTGDTTASITVSPSSTANYIVTVTDGSCSGSDTVEVTVVQPPSAVTISGATQLCEGSSITLTVQGTGPYMWSTGDTLASIMVSPGSNTSYWVQSTNTCGTSSDTANIVVNQPPVLQVSDDTTISIGETVTLTASGADSYLWSTGSASTSINVSPEQTATYTVTGTDSLGCSAEASVTVSISIDAFVYVPNVFSVMSDNLENNRLFVFGQNIKSLELIIYDRWGEKVYEASDPSKKMRSDGECCAYGEGWDGTYKNTGRPLNGSVFVFMLKGEFEDGGEFNESGNITFIE